jgi:hypothetical protein
MQDIGGLLDYLMPLEEGAGELANTPSAMVST